MRNLQLYQTQIHSPWSRYTSKRKPCTSCKLPTLTLPHKPGETEYSVRIKLPEQGKTKGTTNTWIDIYSFHVLVVPGCPEQWKMELKETEIRCGVEKDLHCALKVYAVDRYGNRARAELEAGQAIEPILTVTGATVTASVPKSSKIRETSLRSVSRRTSTSNDPLVPEYRMGAKARLEGKVCKCELAVSDADGKYHSCDDTIALVPGEPDRIALESNIIDDAEKADEQVENTRYMAHVPKKFQLRDLQANLVDSGGNVVQVDAPLTLRATRDSNVSLSRPSVKTRAKDGVARFPTIALSGGKSTKSYTLQVDCQPPALELLSAQLVCNVVLSNAVIEVKPELSVRTAICDKQLDVGLKVELSTEDGNSFVPNADSFNCIIKRKNESRARPSQQHKSATPTFEPFDGGVSVKDGVWMENIGGDARPFVPEQAGVYQITCTYQEARVGIQAPVPLPPPLKLDVHIQAAPPVRLVCLNARGSVNANNGNDVNGRKLLKYNIKCEDKYGNAGLFPEGCIVRAMLVGPADTDPTQWPALEDCEESGVHKGGVVRPAKNMDVGKHERVGMAKFDLYLQKTTGDKEGVYDLRFELFSGSDAKRRHDVESLTIHVNFTPDSIRSKEIEEKQALLDDLDAETSQLTERFDRANEAFRDLKTDMKDKVKRVKGLLSKLAQAGIEWARKDLDACENTPDQVGAAARIKHVLSSSLCEQIATHATDHEQDIERERPRRATVRQRKRMDAIRMLGTPLVELGFADDPDLAHTLAWAAGSPAMDSVVAPDSKKQKELYTVHACNAYSEDQLDVFRTRQGVRSAAHKAQGILPLELPLSHKDGSWPQERSDPVRSVGLSHLIRMIWTLTVWALCWRRSFLQILSNCR